MNNKNITPTPQQPVERIPTGQLSTLLVELDEAALSSPEALPSLIGIRSWICSYDGDDE